LTNQRILKNQQTRAALFHNKPSNVDTYRNSHNGEIKPVTAAAILQYVLQVAWLAAYKFREENQY
jgi:hypothetical protein